MREYINELLKRKDLLVYLVKSGLKAEHRNSYLGYFWWLLDPLLNVVIYYFLIGVLLGRGGDDFAVFLVIGLVGWRWINTTVNTSAKSITKYSSIINQVYLPKSIFPLAMTATQTFNFLFGLIIIAIFLLVFQVTPGWQVVYLPLIILVQLLFLVAISLFVAYICVFVRDIDNILGHILRIFFYGSAIIFNRDFGQYSWIFDINPVAVIIYSYRSVLLWHESPPFFSLSIIAITSIVAILLLIRYYSRNEHKIIKAL
ncbi:ABC transporter permease [Halalkalibacterium halodurans]|uniref:ABC transporter permease n=1 Tax=Halalkalibacterium halodurans TaxID=86665 RepID=UPI002E1A5400|nr:ABC transporter permease [Halalkalibacterium halodurans]